jgi:hypothetical protein
MKSRAASPGNKKTIMATQRQIAGQDADVLGEAILSENRPDVIDYYYEESTAQLHFYFDTMDGIDSKLGILIGLLGVLLAIVGAISFKDTNIPIKAFGAGAIFFFGIALFLALSAHGLKKVTWTPDVPFLVDAYQGEDLLYIKKTVIYYRAKHFRNVFEPLMDRKRKYSGFVLSSAFLGILSLAIGVVWKIARGI